MTNQKETPPKQSRVSTDIIPQDGIQINDLISQAIEKDINVEAMEKLLTLGKEMQAIYAKQEYVKAMAGLQAELPEIKKTKPVRTNSGEIAYRYAPLEDIVRQVKEPLQKYGFSYSTSMELKERGVKVIVKVTHIAGHSEPFPVEVPYGTKTQMMSDSQVAAAAQTFAKRYAFCNAFGILTGDEDNDARPPMNGVEPPKYKKPIAPPQKSFPTHFVKTSQVEAEIKNALNLEDAKKVKEKMKSARIDPKHYPRLLKAVNEKIDMLIREP